MTYQHGAAGKKNFKNRAYYQHSTHNGRTLFITNHNIACSGLIVIVIAYTIHTYIFVRIIFAYSPKMAPISKNHGKQR